MPHKKIFSLIDELKITFIDLRFTDTRGKEHHVSVPKSAVTTEFLTTEGKMFDGSSIAGWQDINESDMALMPDLTTAVLDPFCAEPTLNIRCNVIDPSTMTHYKRCPRAIAKRAEEYLNSSDIADLAYFGPEPEFFIFDSVVFDNNINSSFYKIDAIEGSWNSGTHYEHGNNAHRPMKKGGYFPVPPVDSAQDLRSEMCLTLERLGIPVEAHHHEVATAGQNEIATRFNTLVKKSDELLTLKYVVHNIAHAYGKTATFMPKPLVGDNGSGMHVHQSLFKDNKNLFAGDGYSGLSDLALYYIGGIIKHARALNAFTNPSTNSYKRLVPGFEAPVMLAYSERNRSAAIRIPHVTSSQARRIEVRFPDPTANPYLSFAAMLMAGLDGIKNKIHPGEAINHNLYKLAHETAKPIPTVCSCLKQALDELEKNRDFLLHGDVFTNDFIDSYISLKMAEVARLQLSTHPIEFELYYSL